MSIDQALIQARTPEETDLWIKAGADVNARNKYGRQTALMYANTFDQTKLLVEAGADVNAKDAFGRTALMLTKTAGQTKLLIDAATVAGTATVYVNAKNINGDTALLKANTAEQTKLLLDAGADVNAKNDNGSTALMEARTVSQLEILDEFGADINIKDRYGNKAIHLCRNNLEKMKALVRMGADVEAVGSEGKCPIHVACIRRRHDIVEFLLKEAGVDPTVKDSFGHDAFHYANGDARLQGILAPFH